MNKKLLTPVLIIALAALAFVNYTKRVELSEALKTLSVKMDQLQGGNSEQSAEEAKAIIAKVKRHIVIQGDVEPTVATIVDVDALKDKNEFYKSAKNGDHLLVTPTRAILYDPDTDIIIDVVPVQLQPAEAAPAEESAAAVR